MWMAKEGQHCFCCPQAVNALCYWLLRGYLNFPAAFLATFSLPSAILSLELSEELKPRGGIT